MVTCYRFLTQSSKQGVEFKTFVWRVGSKMNKHFTVKIFIVNFLGFMVEGDILTQGCDEYSARESRLLTSNRKLVHIHDLTLVGSLADVQTLQAGRA